MFVWIARIFKMVLTKQLLEKILIQAILTEGNSGLASRALEALRKDELEFEKSETDK